MRNSFNKMCKMLNFILKNIIKKKKFNLKFSQTFKKNVYASNGESWVAS